MVWHQERKQRFQLPRQRGHYHIRPIAAQIVRGHSHGVHRALEWRDHIFLVTAPVGKPHDYPRRIGAVGSVKAVADFIEKHDFTLADAQILSHYYSPITPPTRPGAVHRLGDVIAYGDQV